MSAGVNPARNVVDIHTSCYYNFKTVLPLNESAETNAQLRAPNAADAAEVTYVIFVSEWAQITNSVCNVNFLSQR